MVCRGAGDGGLLEEWYLFQGRIPKCGSTVVGQLQRCVVVLALGILSYQESMVYV